MAPNNSGFVDGKGVLARDLLVQIGPTLKVDLGFDESYDVDRPSQLASLPVEGAWALIDTGASTCCIDGALARQLGLPIIDQRTYAGIGGSIEVDMHLAQIRAPALSFTLYGSFAAVDLTDGRHPVLIGRDFLRHFVMTYDGLSGAVSLVDPAQPMAHDVIDDDG